MNVEFAVKRGVPRITKLGEKETWAAPLIGKPMQKISPDRLQIEDPVTRKPIPNSIGDLFGPKRAELVLASDPEFNPGARLFFLQEEGCRVACVVHPPSKKGGEWTVPIFCISSFSQRVMEELEAEREQRRLAALAYQNVAMPEHDGDVAHGDGQVRAYAGRR